MNKKVFIPLTIFSAVFLAGSILYFNNKILKQENKKTSTTSPTSNVIDTQVIADNSKVGDVDLTQVGGKYITYEEFNKDREKYAQVKVVYFFRAKWCPTCAILDKDINSNLTKIPTNLVIVDVDYDVYLDLKKNYGITIQHTLVQVDKDAKALKTTHETPDLATVITDLI